MITYSSLTAPSAVARAAAPDDLPSFASAAGVSKALHRVTDGLVDGSVDHAKQPSHVVDSFDASVAAVEQPREAREENSFWTTLGTILLGPLIGTAIGGAVGGGANAEPEGKARLEVHARIRHGDDEK